ncbi:class I SAM-dependent methyltransferase [Thioalkalivibrio paradoxus]|uniref:Type 11 methyltransferase n=1 Tax=Thioalkalivibrio paradoxus ARh 1 TaxID=713585 RepID=W0DML5_9GAMM|nr:class I SAM-dependent methyltransferase [Thioalkalivibrio paradoxus]AHE98512.1 type 11 methyltransferase [Thioalkalivibrio paradoxus ARh 1]
MTEDFYRAFEERYRGPRELIKGRLKVYFPFIDGLRSVHPGMKALDLGCGRGEWLELMREHAIEAQGVDLDTGMLQACRDLDLDVVQKDAVRHLQGQPGASFGVVSAFHVAEHLPFEALQDLVRAALRVLLPGGLLILETPNPENLVVGTANFYLDPTHIRPIPAPLLAFLPEFHGFARCKILGLQEPRQSDGTPRVTLRQVLNDVSPDYAVVAQAPGGADQLSALDEPFARDYGNSLSGLTECFDHQLQAGLTEIKDQVTRIKEDQARMWADRATETRVYEKLAAVAESAAAESAETVQALRKHLSALEERLAAEAEKSEQRVELKEQAVRAEARAEVAERELEALQGRAEEIEKKNHYIQARLAEAEARAQGAELETEALHRSLSWRITAPLRWGLGVLLLISGRRPRPAAPRRWVRSAVLGALGRPRWVALVHRCLRPFPRLHAAVTSKVRGIVAPPRAASHAAQRNGSSVSDANTTGLETLTPRARRIYAELTEALEKRRKPDQ